MGRGEEDSLERRRPFDPVEVALEGYPHLLRAARRLTDTPSDAEDLVQEAFVLTLSLYPGFQDLREPIGYLTTVLYRTAFRTRRLSRRETPLEFEERLQWHESDLDAPAMVVSALALVGSKQRVCLMLRYLHDFDDDEIASLLGCRTSTVRSQIARGLARAREKVGDDTD
jgi:RNA polymerase sigma factor (sigma-70 family)